MNLAALWSLPLILVCENNGFSEFSPTATVTSGQIVDRAKPYGVASVTCDGNDVVDVLQTAAAAIARARAGEGPTLIEARTYRLRGQVESEVTFSSRDYRSEADIASWAKRDPLDRLRERLTGAAEVAAASVDAVDREVDAEVDAAFERAGGDPLPPEAAAYAHMFA